MVVKVEMAVRYGIDLVAQKQKQSGESEIKSSVGRMVRACQVVFEVLLCILIQLVVGAMKYSQDGEQAVCRLSVPDDGLRLFFAWCDLPDFSQQPGLLFRPKAGPCFQSSR